MAIFYLYFENSRKDPFLRLQMRAKEMFNRHQLFFHKQTIHKDQADANETNLWNIFLVKTNYW